MYTQNLNAQGYRLLKNYPCTAGRIFILSNACKTDLFSGEHFTDSLSHDYDNSIYGGHQLGSWDLELLSLLARSLLGFVI